MSEWSWSICPSNLKTRSMNPSIRSLSKPIWANSESGKGSTFSFTIPVEVVQGQQLELGETDRGAVFEKKPGLKSLRILVAEDNPSNQRVLVEMLKRLATGLTPYRTAGKSSRLSNARIMISC